jgi:hypothetical protein
VLTLTPRGESGALAGPRRARGTLAGEPGHVVMTADLGHVPVRRELPAPARPMPAEIPQTTVLVARQPLTAPECGLGEGEDTTGDTRCRDFTPELMIELI